MIGNDTTRSRIDIAQLPKLPPVAPPASPGEPIRRRRWRAPVRVWVRRIHLWTTFSLGLLLLVITTSGAAIVLQPELNRLIHADLFRAAAGAPAIELDDAIDIVSRSYPDNHIHFVTPPRRGDRYLIEVEPEPERAVLLFVDPVKGTLHGPLDATTGPLGWLRTLHTSLFADETLLPRVGWPISQVLLGMSALALVVMAATGAVLWWPGIKRFVRNGFGVRLGRNRYTTNHDLHKVLGFFALLPLMLWGLTGANFEFYEQTRQIWYAVMPGNAPAEVPESVSRSGTAPGISAEEAVARAIAAAPGARFSSITPPNDETDYYGVWLSRGVDTYEYFDWPGTFEVRVDRTNGEVLAIAYTNYEHLTTEIYEGWSYPIHAGTFAPWYLRLFWVVFGLAPLALAITGVGMWWFKRQGVSRGKRRAAQRSLVTGTAARALE